MKKFISIILVILTVISMLAGCSQKTDTPAGSMQKPAANTEKAAAQDGSGAQDTLKNAETTAVQDDPFSEEDYQKLSELQFDGYEEMSVSDYQKKLRELTGTEESKYLLERFFADERLFRMKDDDDTAAFVFYVLEPLTSANWQDFGFFMAADSGSQSPAEYAYVEYTYTLSILHPDNVRVKDYVSFGRKLRQEVLKPTLQNAAAEELRDEAQMRKTIDAYLADELSRMQTEDLSAAVRYEYFRPYEEDYTALLTLMTSNYRDMTLADFDAALRDWADADPKRMERIAQDLVRNTFGVNMGKEETAFVMNTIFLSYIENGGYDKEGSEQETENRVFGSFPQKVTAENGAAAWYSLHYAFTYRVSDPASVTVGERDDCISSMRTAIYTFWDETDLDALLQMSSQELTAKLLTFAEKCSTEHVTIFVGEDAVQLEQAGA